MTPLERKLAAYERQVLALMDRSQRLEAKDLLRIRRRFRLFLREALRYLPTASALSQATVPSVLRELAVEIDRLQRDLGGIVRDGLTAKAELGRELGRLFGQAWLDRVIPIAGAQTRLLDAAYEYSARLVGWNNGGLAAAIQGQVDHAIRLGVLGLDGGVDAKAEISRALGLGRQWTVRAERIYRTETLRFFSMLTQSNADSLDRITPVVKRWYWSGISREEHARIHGQTVPLQKYFRVPRRGGGAVLIPYPRAVRDRHGNLVPGDVSINCGCWHVPIPASAAGLAATSRAAPLARRGKRTAA